jgi:hypothetical protein
VFVAVAVGVLVRVAVPVGVGVRVGVGVGVWVGVAVGVLVRVTVLLGVAVRVAVGLGEGVGVGVGRKKGAENAEVLLLMSVLVAVTCGPLTGPLNVQLPSLVKTEPSKTRPSSSESEKISTAHGAHAVPWSGPLPTMTGGARLSLPLLMSTMPAASLE